MLTKAKQGEDDARYWTRPQQHHRSFVWLSKS